MDVTPDEETRAEAKKKRELRDEAWRIVANIVVPILFVALVPVAAGLWYLGHESSARDRAAATATINRLRLQAATDAWARYDDGIKGCRRGKRRDAHIKNLEQSVVATNNLLSAFFGTSGDLRASTGKTAAARQAIRARNEIRKIAKGIHTIPVVNCVQTIAQPLVARPDKPKRAKPKPEGTT